MASRSFSKATSGELTGDPVRLGRLRSPLFRVQEERGLPPALFFPQQTRGFGFINGTANSLWQQTIHERLDQRFVRVLFQMEFA